MPDSCKPLRVLIVEDSAVSAMIMEAQIHRKEPHFSVKVQRTLTGSLEEWKEFKPHVVLLDLYLPDSDAEETVKRIKDFYPSCVIAMSGDPSLEECAMANGAKVFMEKVIGENAAPFLKRITDLSSECTNTFP